MADVAGIVLVWDDGALTTGVMDWIWWSLDLMSCISRHVCRWNCYNVVPQQSILK